MIAIATDMAIAMPRNLPRMTLVRPMGLETTVRTVLFSISREIAAVEMNAASMIPSRNTPPIETSRSILSSPVTSPGTLRAPMVKPTIQVLSSWMNAASSIMIKNTGWRMLSLKALRAIGSAAVIMRCR